MEDKLVDLGMVRDGNNVLVLALYPCDDIFGCGGAIIHHITAGNTLRLIILSDDPTNQIANVEQIRKESHHAAKILGCGEPEFWGLTGRDLKYGESLVLRVLAAIEKFQVDLVYVASIFETDTGHHAVAMAVVEAIRRYSGQLKLMMYQVNAPINGSNDFLDITAVRQRKQAAISCFSPQSHQNFVSLPKEKEVFLMATSESLKFDLLKIYGTEHLHNQAMDLVERNENASKVSILVRSMDRPLLQDALESIALQTYQNIEVVVINARDQEHSFIGAQCGRFPLRVVSINTALKRSKAANVGLDNATGQYVLFLDDDDWFAPNHVSNLVQALLDDSSRKAAYAGVSVRGENRQIMDTKPFNESFNAGRLRGGNYIPLHALIFQRSLLDKGLRFDEAFDAYEDWDFFLQLSQLTAFTHVDIVSAFYRASGTSGVGIHADQYLQSLARIQIFEKWKEKWSGSQIDEMVQFPVIFQKSMQTQLDDAHSALDEAHLALSEAHTALAHANKSTTETKAYHEKQLAFLASEMENKLAEKDVVIDVKDGIIYDMLHSKSWRFSAPLRRVGGMARHMKQFIQGLKLGFSEWILGKRPWRGRVPDVTQGFAGESIGETGVSAGYPLVSVVMPVYNACRSDRRFLLCALESIANQTYKNVELIIVDDGSTDDTKAVCEDYLIRHPELRAQYLSKENGGQSSARNFGVKACSGKYVGFLDQDDEWYENKLELVIPWLENKQIDVLYTDADSIDGDDKVTFGSIHLNHHCGWPHPKKSIEDILFKDVFIMPGLMTIKKEAFEQIEGFDEVLSGYEDDDLFLRLYEKFKVFYLPTPTLRWRMYGDNYSFSHRMLASRTYYWKKLLKNYTSNGSDHFRKKMISLRFFWQFMGQARAQYLAGNELCWQSFNGAREILPHLPWIQRVVFSIIFLFPSKIALPIIVRNRKVVHSN